MRIGVPRSGIGAACPSSSVHVVDLALMGVWEAKINSLREHVVVTAWNLPPRRVRDENYLEDVVLVPQGPGWADIAASGYTDDTEPVAPDVDALPRLAPATE